MFEVGNIAMAEVSLIHLIIGAESILSKRSTKSPVLNDSGNPSSNKELVETLGGPKDVLGYPTNSFD